MAGRSIYIYCCHFDASLDQASWTRLLNIVSEDIRGAVRKFVRWEDRHRVLYGKLLLRKGLIRMGMEPTVLARLQYTGYGRPYIEDALDFNISHSGNYILCAIGRDLRLGIDIEMVRPVNFEHFTSIMDQEQWDIIHRDKDPLTKFFHFWTLKESVIKANGKGLSIPLNQLKTNFATAWAEKEPWEIHRLNISPGYESCLATNHQGAKTERIRIGVEEFLE